MAKLKRVRKLLFAAVGFAASLAVLLPPQAPSKMREGAAVVIALATLLGVYQVRNDRPVTREDLARKIDYHATPVPPRRDDVAGPPRRHVQGDQPDRPGSTDYP
jgi:hypothetical protein